MSVAFRRDSDEEHLEPRFELPIPPGPNLVTARGLAMIEARIAEYEEALDDALDDGARKPIERDLRYWRQRLATAQIAPAPAGNTAAFGARVTFTRGGEARTLDLVGHDESDPATHRIAFTAPLARALIGGEVGDDVDFGGTMLTIIAIDLIAES